MQPRSPVPHQPNPSSGPDALDGPAGFRPIAEAAIGEMARLVAEIRERYRSGDYAAVLSSLAGLEENRQLLSSHVGELWAWGLCPLEPDDADGHVGLYL